MAVYLSASSIADFIKCSQKVMYRIKKPIKEVQSKEMIVGTISHFAIEKGWDNRDRAISIVRDEAKRYPLVKKADIVHMEFMMDVFFLNFRPKLGEQDIIEHRFKLPLYDDVFIVGKMDRISQGGIWDWKTSGKLPTKLGNDVQCIIYDWAFQKQFGKKANSIVVAGLSTGELVPYKEDRRCVNEIFTNIIPRMIKTIRHDTYERLGMFNHSCFRCPWKEGCLGGEIYELDNTISPE